MRNAKTEKNDRRDMRSGHRMTIVGGAIAVEGQEATPRRTEGEDEDGAEQAIV